MTSEVKSFFIHRGVAKKSWSNSEDMQLLQLIEEHGPSNWTLIAEKLVNRTGKQCRERFHNHLHPDVKKGEWSEEEDVTLAEMHHKLGNQWAKIAKFLPGRTDNAIKNRWHTAHREYASPVTSSKPVQMPTKTSTQSSRMAQPLVPSLNLRLCLSGDEDRYDHSSHSHELTLSSRTDESSDVSESQAMQIEVPCSYPCVRPSLVQQDDCLSLWDLTDDDLHTSDSECYTDSDCCLSADSVSTAAPTAKFGFSLRLEVDSLDCSPLSVESTASFFGDEGDEEVIADPCVEEDLEDDLLVVGMSPAWQQFCLSPGRPQTSAGGLPSGCWSTGSSSWKGSFGSYALGSIQRSPFNPSPGVATLQKKRRV